MRIFQKCQKQCRLVKYVIYLLGILMALEVVMVVLTGPEWGFSMERKMTHQVNLVYSQSSTFSKDSSKFLLQSSFTLEFRINVQDVYSLFKLFSKLYAVIWVYTFIDFKEKDPTCTFIQAYTIISFFFIHSMNPIKLGRQPGLLAFERLQKTL